MDVLDSPVPKTTCFCLDNPQIPQGWVSPRIGHFMAIYFNCQRPFWEVFNKVFSDVNRKLLKENNYRRGNTFWQPYDTHTQHHTFTSPQRREIGRKVSVTELLLWYLCNECSCGLRFWTLKIKIILTLIFRRCFTLKIYCKRPALHSILSAILWEPF